MTTLSDLSCTFSSASGALEDAVAVAAERDLAGRRTGDKARATVLPLAPGLEISPSRVSFLPAEQVCVRGTGLLLLLRGSVIPALQSRFSCSQVKSKNAQKSLRAF